MLKVTRKTAFSKKIKPIQKIQPNYYVSIASVDNNTTESTCTFLEILNKRINICVENTSKTKINS